MSITGYIEALLGGLEANTKRALTEVFRYDLPNHKFGPVDHQTKSENFQGYYVSSTADSSTGEFSIVHGLGRTPYLMVPVVPLDVVGARSIPLTVTRAADGNRVYVKTEAGSTSAPFFLYLE
jgi:hypothetical protein